MKQISLLFLIFIICFSSCQNEIEGELSPTNPPSGDSSYLSRYYKVDYDNGVIDTFERVTYLYDNLKRVTQILDTNGGIGSNIFSISNTQFFYNAAEESPYKRREIYNENNNITDTSITFFTYNPSGLRTMDSTIISSFTPAANGNPSFYYKSLSIQTYSYTNNKIYAREIVTGLVNAGSVPQYRFDTATTDTRGNITELRTLEYFEGDYDNRRVEIDNLAYDNYPSPLSRLNIKNAMPLFSFYLEANAVERNAFNNFVSIHISHTEYNNGVPSTVDTDYNYTGQYSYQANGLPILILEHNPLNPLNDLKDIFIYTL